MLTESSIKPFLPIAGLGDPLIYLEETESTNSVAADLVLDGSPHGTLVVADHQTAGKGRGGRKWITIAGGGLALSLVLRPDRVSAEGLAGLAGLGALGVVEGLRANGLGPKIKWPNDVLLNERKVAGVLVETSWLGEKVLASVLGIGVNVHPSSVPPSTELSYPTTCLDDEAHRTFDRTRILIHILEGVGRWLPELGSEKLVMAWNMHLAFTNQDVVITGVGEDRVGVVTGMQPDGGLLLRTDEGDVSIHAGDVTLRPIDRSMK